MKVLTAFARLAEHPSQTVRWSSGFAAVTSALGLLMILLGGMLSLFVGSEAFLVTSFIWKMVWNLMQIAIPLGATAAALRLHAERRLADREAASERELGKARWMHLKCSGIVLLCAIMSTVATIGNGSTLFRAAGYDDVWFAMMTQDFFCGMGYISLFAVGIMLLYYIMHYLRRVAARTHRAERREEE